jgi:hypothetical protein
MLFVSNTAEIQDLIKSKAPRPIHEVMLEIYPEAKADSRGRFHAPYDDYMCPITGLYFRAGEFLPMQEADDAVVRMGPAKMHPQAVDAEGQLHTWYDLTRAQRVAVFAKLIEMTRERDSKLSKHIGQIGDKLSVEVDLVGLFRFDGYYGPTHIHIMKDKANNVIVYKGGKRLAEKGAKFTLQAKIKSHGEREGVAQTIVERPKMVK